MCHLKFWFNDDDFMMILVKMHIFQVHLLNLRARRQQKMTFKANQNEIEASRKEAQQGDARTQPVQDRPAGPSRLECPRSGSGSYAMWLLAVGRPEAYVGGVLAWHSDSWGVASLHNRADGGHSGGDKCRCHERCVGEKRASHWMPMMRRNELSCCVFV